ncbi:hypothetical protein BGZ58_010728, partial [Dissophora ornata]
MSVSFGRKTARTILRSINYARGLVVCLYIVSWSFSFAAALLVQTNNYNIISCQFSSLLCIFLYASSKIFIYLFLIERVHIVTALGVTRWNCLMFKFNMALLLPYIGIATLAVIYRTVEVTDNGMCRMRLLKESSVPLIAYDTVISSWLTALFVRSLVSSTSMLRGPTSSKLREVARRALIGSVLALVLSSANISTFLIFQNERGLFCLALCTLDVTLNAIAIHWVTSCGDSNSSRAEADRVSFGGGGDGRQFPEQGIDKQLSSPMSHISVSIESYVEEYHQMRLAN